jgi:hypothetical protein
MHPVGAEEATLNKSPQNTLGIATVDEEGVEVIMVDDAQPEPPEKHPASQPLEYSDAPRYMLHVRICKSEFTAVLSQAQFWSF